MKTINKKTLQGEWFDYDKKSGIRLKIKPFTLFNLNQLPSQKDTPKFKDIYEDMWDSFNYCLVDWEGFKDSETGDKAECSEENKKLVFEYDDKIQDFVSKMSGEIRKNILKEDELKN